uniref:Ig-like domain-containing protein n=1 Tax=Stegastes partitus TaxID=144197 RepID=A0A3B5A750_9TELE
MLQSSSISITPPVGEQIKLQSDSCHQHVVLCDNNTAHSTSATDVWVQSGEMAEFSCSFDGQPFSAVVWDHNGQNLADTERVRSSQSGAVLSLVIQGVGVADQGRYRCTATNPHVSNRFGRSTCTSYLHVEVKEPEEQDQDAGRTFPAPTGKPPEFTKTIECLQYIVTGEPLPEVQWLKGSFHIQPSGFCIIVNNPDGSGFIHIKSVKQEHSGVYTCKASNQYGEASCTAELLVFRAKAQEEHTLVQKVMQCVITGSGPLSVVWFKDSQALPTVPTHYQTSCEKNKHTLDITKLEAADCGLYVCKASNNVGTAECSAELRVIDQPNFVKPLGAVAAVVGAPLHLECQVDEDTGVTVTWTRDGRKVHQSPDCKLSFEDKTVTLDILKTTLKDCGNYVCVVTNEAGSASCSTSVKVQGKSCLVNFHGYCSI